MPSSGHIYSLYCAIHTWFHELKSTDRFYTSMQTIYQLQPRVCHLEFVWHYATQSPRNQKMPHQGTFSACIMWFISDIRGLNNRTSSMHLCERFINSNLEHVICSPYISTTLNLCKARWPLQNTYLDYIVWFICACERFSLQTSSLHVYRQHINSNLGYDICSVYSNLCWAACWLRICHHIPSLRV